MAGSGSSSADGGPAEGSGRPGDLPGDRPGDRPAHSPAGGSRAGSRRGPRRRARPSPALLGLTAGITALVVAWGYLVWAAIDFGASARAGESAAWGFLALASLGAVACLFAGLMLGIRLLRALGIMADAPASGPDTPPAPKGGKRAAR